MTRLEPGGAILLQMQAHIALMQRIHATAGSLDMAYLAKGMISTLWHLKA